METIDSDLETEFSHMSDSALRSMAARAHKRRWIAVLRVIGREFKRRRHYSHSLDKMAEAA